MSSKRLATGESGLIEVCRMTCAVLMKAHVAAQLGSMGAAKTIDCLGDGASITFGGDMFAREDLVVGDCLGSLSSVGIGAVAGWCGPIVERLYATERG